MEVHYLGFGPADVPVDRPLMAANPRVSIFARHDCERVTIARRLAAVPKPESLDDLLNKKIAVPGPGAARAIARAGAAATARCAS